MHVQDEPVGVRSGSEEREPRKRGPREIEPRLSIFGFVRAYARRALGLRQRAQVLISPRRHDRAVDGLHRDAGAV